MDRRRKEIELNPEFEGYQNYFLIEEMQARGFTVTTKEEDVKPLIEKIYFLRRNNQDYQKELDSLIAISIGRY